MINTLLVTGGAGFIGSNFIYNQLSERPGRRIVCLDKLTYAGNINTLAPALARPEFRFVKGDIADAETVKTVFDACRPDAVVNFAAESHVDRSIEDPGLFLHTNVLGAQVLMDECRKRDIRFHQVSTDEVYGDLPLDSRQRFTEEYPLKASSPYSASKAGADLLVGAYCRTYGLNATISRCSNNYGPFQFPEKLIPLLITRAVNDLPLPIYGQGKNIRDWLFVTDHCAAIDLILEKGQNGKVYNLGGDCEMRNLDIARSICRALGKPESLISFVPDRKGHDLRYAMDYSLAEKELGWTPKTGFDSGLDITVRWYLDHARWLEDINSGAYRKAESI